MTHTDDLSRTPLAVTAAAAHNRARAALARPDRVMDAVVWLSAHLTAMEHVVYPFIRTNLPMHRADLEVQRRLTRRMQRTLRLLEQHLAGDGLAPPGSSDRLRGELMALIDEHEAGEAALLACLSDIADEAALDLAERYDQAIGHGPTRPHPHGPHRGKLGALTYTLDAARDHILDVLDSRHVPLPRPPRPHQEVGRWGRYLLGRGEAMDQPVTRARNQAAGRAAPRRRR